MNELLAIVIIVIVCCAIFFAWLLSMATCPDKMINWLSGTAGNTTCSTSYESKELIAREDPRETISSHANAGPSATTSSSVYLQLGNVARRSTSKKLSVVPEQDEQLTVTSISQILFPSAERSQPSSSGKGGAPLFEVEKPDYVQRLESQFEQITDDYGPEEVLVINDNDNHSQMIPIPMESNEDERAQPLGNLPIRYHYSAPVIHVV